MFDSCTDSRFLSIAQSLEFTQRMVFHELELKSVVEQVENLRKNLKGISEDDRATIEAHESFAILEQLNKYLVF